jgi:hypothetical protein
MRMAEQSGVVKYHVLAAAVKLGEFTVTDIATRVGVIEPSTRAVLNRYAYLFTKTTERSRKRGGQLVLWKVKDRAALERIVREHCRFCGG